MMENALLLLGALCYVNSAMGVKCPEIPLQNKNVTCYCSQPSSYTGWHKECISSPITVDGPMYKRWYELIYLTDKRLTLNCDYNTDISYTPGMFDNVDAPELSKVWIVNCPVPKIPMYQLLHHFKVNHLKISSDGESSNLTLDSNFLRGLSELKILILDKCGINGLSSDFLSNSTKLKIVAIQGNKLKTLPDSLFTQLPGLTSIFINDNHLLSVPETLFRGLSRLKVLDMYNNNLTSLPDGIFNGLSNITVLQLHNNFLVNLSADLFADLVNLTQIGLSGNKFETLPETLFSRGKIITAIILSKNRFKFLPGKLLFGLNKLEKLLLSDCNMTTYPDDFLHHAPNLKLINLYNNRLSRIPNGFFSKNSKMQDLRIEYNDFEDLADGSFKGLLGLKSLRLGGNNIKSIGRNAFEGLVSLEEIRLGHNEIKTLNGGTFSRTPNLVKVDLSRNKLKVPAIGHHFSMLKRLQVLNLAHNKMREVPVVQNLLHLKQINMEFNDIQVLDPIHGLAPDTKYKLMNNNISLILMMNLKAIMWISKDDKLRHQLSIGDNENLFPNPSIYMLANNPIACDCVLTDFLTYLKKMVVMFEGRVPIKFEVLGLKCAEPKELRGYEVLEIEPDEPICSITEDCPQNCTCYFRDFNRTTTLLCADMELYGVPKTIPHNTSTATFRNLTLQDGDLAFLQLPNYANITRLHLNDNNITFIKEKYLPKKLELLDLSGNSMKLMPFWLPKYSKSRNMTYYFANNTWMCNCSARAFKGWLTQNHKQVKDIRQIICHGDADNEYGGRSILHLSDEQLCPIVHKPNQLLIGLTSSIVIVSLILMVAAILYYKQRQNIIVFLFAHNMCQLFFKEEDLDEDKLFDAFISYSYHNRDFVIDELIPELEEKDPKFQLCIHERNFLPGRSIVENIINAIELSRRTVIILSKDFVESDWGMLEFSVAHHQMLKDCVNRVVVVVVDEITEKAKSIKELQFFLSTKTYLKKDELWFWDKLRHALPRRPISVKNKGAPLLALPNLDQQKKLKPKIDEVREEISNKISLKLENDSDVKKRNGDIKLNGVINPIFNNHDHVKFNKNSAIQMQPTGKYRKNVKENLI